MLISHDRDKLINAINYFVSNTKKCGKVKLFKLLYFLDFEHFKQTGRSVTELKYFAWKMGPVPVDLFEEIESPEPDMAENFRFEQIPVSNGEYSMLSVKPQKPFSDKHFSRREMGILNDLANRYKDSSADKMIEQTHLENQPWHKIYIIEKARQSEIPYNLAVPNNEKDLIQNISSERKEIIKAFS